MTLLHFVIELSALAFFSVVFFMTITNKKYEFKFLVQLFQQCSGVPSACKKRLISIKDIYILYMYI